MNTMQSNEQITVNDSQPVTPENPTESITATISPIIDLRFGVGMDAAALYYALSDYTDELRKLSTDHLAAGEIDEHLKQEDELNAVVQMMMELFMSVNEVARNFIDKQVPDRARKPIADLDARRKAKLLHLRNIGEAL